MKFDVVIGNPPYQEIATGGNKTFLKPIYPGFMEAAYRVGDNAIFITPARFLFNAGGAPKVWNRKMLNDPHLKVSYFNAKSGDVFPDVDFRGGVAITRRDVTKVSRAIGVFIPYRELQSIVQKVESLNGEGASLADIAVSSSSYSFTEELIAAFPGNAVLSAHGAGYTAESNAFKKFPEVFLEEPPDSSVNYFEIVGRHENSRCVRYVDSRYLNKPGNFPFWKVLVSNSNGTGTLGGILAPPMVCRPGVGNTRSFMSFGYFQTSNQAHALLLYLKSKFARVLLGVFKVTQANPPAMWAKVPLQDFTDQSDIDWSKSIPEIDQQLYAKYGLSADEIDFIERHAKEMK